jgi:RNA polymerase sigma factor (TIGR02999 family)
MTMSNDPSGEITVLLQAAKAGQPGALDRLFSLVYDELRKIAKNRVDANNQWASEPTTLVHEAYLRLVKRDQTSWVDRHHFFWAAARAMRDILVERARRECAAKRGGGRNRIELNEDMVFGTEAPDLIDLNEALLRLEAVHPRSAEVVALQFFAGLNREQIAEILNISPSAVWREWSFARAWLLSQLDDSNSKNEKS